MCPLFQEKGEVLRFYLPLMKDRRLIIAKIEENGGIIVTGKVGVHEDGIITLTTKRRSSSNVKMVHIDFITDSISLKELQDIRKYTISGKQEESSSHTSRNSDKINPKDEEDDILDSWDVDPPVRRAYTNEDNMKMIDYILSEVRTGHVVIRKSENGNTRLTVPNRVWMEMECAKLPHHSWESLRNHYRLDSFKKMLAEVVEGRGGYPEQEIIASPPGRREATVTKDEGEKATLRSTKRRKIMELEPEPEPEPEPAKETHMISEKDVGGVEMDMLNHEQLRETVDILSAETGEAKVVVVHAIYVCNGDIKQAQAYLLRKGNERMNHKKWDKEEDSILVDGSEYNSEDAILRLVDAKGDRNVEERLSFLVGEFSDESGDDGGQDVSVNFPRDVKSR